MPEAEPKTPARFRWHPDFVIREALARGVESAALFESVWQREPERAASELTRALESNDARDVTRLSGLLAATPPTQFARLSELLSQPSLANLDREKLGCVRRFLHDQIRLRKAGYVEAYARLSAIERLLAH